MTKEEISIQQTVRNYGRHGDLSEGNLRYFMEHCCLCSVLCNQLLFFFFAQCLNLLRFSTLIHQNNVLGFKAGLPVMACVWTNSGIRAPRDTDGLRYSTPAIVSVLLGKAIVFRQSMGQQRNRQLTNEKVERFSILIQDPL